jgi:hypothetical protein
MVAEAELTMSAKNRADNPHSFPSFTFTTSLLVFYCGAGLFLHRIS